MANPDLAFGALAKPSRFKRDVDKHQRRVARAQSKRALDKAQADVWRAICEAVFKRDQGLCRVCGRGVQRLNGDPHRRAETHHIRYRSAGGSDESSNLILTCGFCHYYEHQHRIDISGDGDRVVTITQVMESGKSRTWESPCPSTAHQESGR
jgi:5-methylcytosine-specific restriction endonuclease McrA